MLGKQGQPLAVARHHRVGESAMLGGDVAGELRAVYLDEPDRAIAFGLIVELRDEPQQARGVRRRDERLVKLPMSLLPLDLRRAARRAGRRQRRALETMASGDDL